jgi:peptidoglycan/xylan/chitin deacetylase (PgdA/CDA1 family)
MCYELFYSHTNHISRVRMGGRVGSGGDTTGRATVGVGMKHELLQLGLPVAPSLGLFTGRISVPPAVLRPALVVAKFLGLFQIARYITRDGLRIICYHGLAVAEEYKYRSRLFIQKELFRRRIEYLQCNRYPILPLGEAVEALAQGRLPYCATVVTMDDGWEGVYSVALPIIKELGIPVTLYVPTFYVAHPMPVFTVTLSYLFWRTTARRVELPRGLGEFALDSGAEQAEAVAQEVGGTLPAAGRLQFLKEMAEALDVSFADIETQRLFRAVDEHQLRQLADAGVDIQLHSHRHQWSADDSRTTVEAEIADNRRFLEQVVYRPLEHFCYPSGIHGPHQGEWLAALGVKSATTIEPGLNYPDTSRFALRRMVDGHPVCDIEFEAEMTGFMEIVRALRERRLIRMLRRRLRSHRASGASSLADSGHGRETRETVRNR